VVVFQKVAGRTFATFLGFDEAQSVFKGWVRACFPHDVEADVVIIKSED
jgi:hypothetical protein